MVEKIASFILDLRWHLKKEGRKKKYWREDIAQKYRETSEFKHGIWTTQMFIDTWEELVKLGSIK